VFEANPDFPAELGGRPYLDRLVYRSIPEQTTLLTELLTGRIDYYIAPSPENAQRIRQSQQARLITYPDRAFVLIGWNHRRPQFADPRVRRALTMAINRDEIIEGIMYGFGTVANSTVPPFYWNHDPQAGQELRHDPEGARRLLAEAGWTPGPDGVLRNAQGQPFRFTLVTNQGNQERIDITQKVQSDLARIGIQAQPQQLEWGTLLSRLQDVEARNFDAVVIGWVTEFRIDDTDLFACDKRNDPYQWVGYCNPQTDRLLERLPLIVDRDQAKPLWEQYQRQIAADQPYTFLYFQERREGVSNRLRNVNPDARGDWVGAQKWYLHPEGRRGGAAPATAAGGAPAADAS
jgi:peptide/nickel transport system substrate-binding protein